MFNTFRTLIMEHSMDKVRIIIFASAGLLFSFTCPAFSQDKACLMEGTFSFGGQTTEIKDCFQNNGAPQDMFTKTCDSLAQSALAFGGSPAKITYMTACPSQSQGSCKGFFGQSMTSYYYKRDINTLPDVKSSCEAQGGTWKKT